MGSEFLDTLQTTVNMGQLQIQVNLALIHRVPCRIIRALRVIVPRIDRRKAPHITRLLVVTLVRTPPRRTMVRQQTMLPLLRVIHPVPLQLRAIHQDIHRLLQLHVTIQLVLLQETTQVIDDITISCEQSAANSYYLCGTGHLFVQ